MITLVYSKIVSVRNNLLHSVDVNRNFNQWNECVFDEI